MVPVLHVLLTILKILGIGILAILGVLLLVLVLVLFVPVCYKAKGEYYGKDACCDANVSWLFNFIHFRAGYKYSKPLHMRLKIVGITFYDNLRVHNKKKEKKNKKIKKQKKADSKVIGENDENIIEEEISSPVIASGEDLTENSVEASAENSFEISNEDLTDAFSKHASNEQDCQKQEKTGIIGKIAVVFKNIKFTFEKICDSIKETKENIEYYVKLINLESTKAAFRQCKKQILKLLKLLCPRRFCINLHIGFEDPSTMGEVLAVWGMVYPWIVDNSWRRGRIDIRPEFETAVLEGDFNCKGRICLVSVIKAVCILYFDRNVKLFIKRLKGKTNNNRED